MSHLPYIFCLSQSADKTKQLAATTSLSNMFYSVNKIKHHYELYIMIMNHPTPHGIILTHKNTSFILSNMIRSIISLLGKQIVRRQISFEFSNSK